MALIGQGLEVLSFDFEMTSLTEFAVFYHGNRFNQLNKNKKYFYATT
jgi:hypothetical protein